MTNQEIFNAVVKGIYKQGKPSVSNDFACRYRSEDGCKCAAGLLIPDEVYTPEMEGKTSHYLRSKLASGQSLPWTVEQDPLVRALQRAHDEPAKVWMGDKDNAKFIEGFKNEALTVANIWNLFGWELFVKRAS